MQEVPQRVVCKPHPELLAEELNEAIRNGWRIIPDSIKIGPKSPDGKVEQQCMAIIYRETEVLEPPATAAEAVKQINDRRSEKNKKLRDGMIECPAIDLFRMLAESGLTEKQTKSAFLAFESIVNRSFTVPELIEVIRRAKC